MTTRRGLGAGRGKGYRNLIPHDKPVHRDSGRGIKQPQIKMIPPVMMKPTMRRSYTETLARISREVGLAPKQSLQFFNEMKNYPHDPYDRTLTVYLRDRARAIKSAMILGEPYYDEEKAYKFISEDSRGRVYQNIKTGKYERTGKGDNDTLKDETISILRVKEPEKIIGGLGDNWSKETQKELDDLEKHQYQMTSSDLQGAVMALARKNGEDVDEMLEYIYQRREKIVGGLGDKYGVMIDGKLIPYEVDDKSKAETDAKRWKGEVVNLTNLRKGIPYISKESSVGRFGDKMLLIGHAKGYDVYEDKEGNLYHYIGKNKEDFENQNFWKKFYTARDRKEKIVGGLGDNRPDSDFPKAELKKGIKVEMEHTKDPKVAKEIVKDHLTEFPKGYYKELAKTEDKLKKMNVPLLRTGGELYQSKQARDKRFAELKARYGDLYRKESHRGQQLHPEYVKDWKGELETGFGNTQYRTFFPVLYAIDFKYGRGQGEQE